VAQRGGAITIYEKNRANENYGPDPVFEISGPKTKLNCSDGVAFVPPNNDCLAACNLAIGSISFYRRLSRSPIGFKLGPVFELKHRSLSNPDGLAFSQCGTWLAVANHGNHSVSIFQRRKSNIFSGKKLKYGPKPVTIIKDPGLRHPHSVAFTPETNHLVVTNAGANYFSVYEPKSYNFKMQWSQSPPVQKTVGPDSIFKEVNARNKMEGGPKGVAIHKSSLAICSPEHGVKIYSFREGFFVR
jgi:DNA-binding beta-propeller fold protein YncE